MASLYLRNVPDDLIRRLKVGAVESGETLRAHCIRLLERWAEIPRHTHPAQAKPETRRKRR